MGQRKGLGKVSKAISPKTGSDFKSAKSDNLGSAEDCCLFCLLLRNKPTVQSKKYVS